MNLSILINVNLSILAFVNLSICQFLQICFNIWIFINDFRGLWGIGVLKGDAFGVYFGIGKGLCVEPRGQRIGILPGIETIKGINELSLNIVI